MLRVNIFALSNLFTEKALRLSSLSMMLPVGFFLIDTLCQIRNLPSVPNLQSLLFPFSGMAVKLLSSALSAPIEMMFFSYIVNMAN